jgi:hypothetical protein
VLTNEAVPVRDRVRLGCALGAIVAGLLLYPHGFSTTPERDYEQVLRELVADILPTG